MFLCSKSVNSVNSLKAFYRAVPPPSLMVILKRESGPIVDSGRARSHHAHRDHNHHQYYHHNLLDRSPADIPELIAEVLVASDKGADLHSGPQPTS